MTLVFLIYIHHCYCFSPGISSTTCDLDQGSSGLDHLDVLNRNSPQPGFSTDKTDSRPNSNCDTSDNELSNSESVCTSSSTKTFQDLNSSDCDTRDSEFPNSGASCASSTSISSSTLTFQGLNSSDCDTDSDYSHKETVDYVNEETATKINLLSCFLKHNLTGSACRDIIKTFQSNFTDSDSMKSLNYDDLWKSVDNFSVIDKHYCFKCNAVFPDDKSIFQCDNNGCDGLRYKGTHTQQTLIGRQPRDRFVITDLRAQLKLLLESPGVWADITANKAVIQQADDQNIQDITDGIAYRELLKPGQFLSDGHNITCVMNTDGVNLYSSSRVELWPLFLTINELSPAARYARDNILLAGLWQGKGKPPFKQYLSVFASELNALRERGVDIVVNNVDYNVKVSVLCATLDLPAKASVLCMTQFNGAHACITCEEPGEVVAQGKGHARSYPYRNDQQRHPERKDDDVRVCMEIATDKKRVKGFRGQSGLLELEGFDFVSGTVPDYMHGLLLGITKTLLCKWISPTQSNQPFFIGKSLKEVSKRLNSIHPPDFIERLPRDLERHYNHFKATELQTWLLFYCVPCLQGILPDEYLEHIALLSEAAHILLRDFISQSDLTKAESLLDDFYSRFENLYDSGSCGLNVHNAGRHLVYYVRQWGPLWAWSCFAFEDANAMLLQSAHGTGDVTNQVIKNKIAMSMIRKHSHTRKYKNAWKNLKQVSNCAVAGKIKKLDRLQPELVEKLTVIANLDVANIPQFSKVERLVIEGHRFYSAEYTRMKKRECSVVQLNDNRYGRILQFVLHQNTVYVVLKILRASARHLQFAAGKHLVSVENSDETEIVPAESLRETVMYIKCTDNGAYVSKAPNKHGHSVFK